MQEQTSSLTSLSSHISTGKLKPRKNHVTDRTYPIPAQLQLQPLRKQPTRSRSRSRLSSLTSLSSHISTCRTYPRKPRDKPRDRQDVPHTGTTTATTVEETAEQRNRSRSRLSSLTSLSSHISTWKPRDTCKPRDGQDVPHTSNHVNHVTDRTYPIPAQLQLQPSRKQRARINAGAD